MAHPNPLHLKEGGTVGAAAQRCVRLSWLPALLLLISVPGHAAGLPQSLFATNWYTVLIMGNRSGYSCQTLRDSGNGIESVEQTLLRVRMDAQTLTVSREERRCYDADLKLVSIENEADQVGRKTKISVTREGDRLSYVKTSPDGEKRQSITVPRDFGAELETLRTISAGGLKPGWTASFTTFDCDLLKIDTITMTALEATEQPRPGWIVKAQSALLGLETKTWIGRDGTLLRQEVPGMMGMTLVLASEAEALAEMSPLLLSTSIPISRDLKSAQGLASLTMRASSRTHPVSEMIPSTARQSLSEDEQSLLVKVRAETGPDLTVKLPVRQPEFQEYLQPSDLAQSADPLIAAKAREIIGDETDAWRAAQKLLAWVNRNLVKVASEPRPVSAREILATMSGDCTEHSILLAALAQAVGIPAKLAAGLVYDNKAYHYHAWNELYVGRWVEVDATWNQPTVDAGHLLIASAALDGAAMARLSLASGRTMGSLDLEILSVEQAK